jgi:hypothetical protein
LESFVPEGGVENKEVAMRGRLSTDYSGYTHEGLELYRRYDRIAQIEISPDESEVTDFCVMLIIKRGIGGDLDCCGP